MRRKKLLSVMLSVMLVLGMVITPGTALAENESSNLFTLSVDGTEMDLVTVTEKGYTYVDTYNETNQTVDLYTVTIPEGTSQVDLVCAKEVLVYNYTPDGKTYLAGWVDDYTKGSTEITCSVDADGDGVYDVLQVQNPYNEDYSGGELLYAITFAEKKNTTDKTFTVTANGNVLKNPVVTKNGYTYVDTYAGTSQTVDLYTFKLYKGIKTVDLAFAYRRLAYNYDVDGKTYLDGYYDDYVTGSKTATCSVDFDKNGVPDIIQVQNTYNEDWSGAEVLYAITFKMVDAYPAPGNLKLTNTAKGIKVTWDKVEDASRYILYRKVGSGNYKAIKTTKNASFTDENVKNGSKYTYKVEASDKAGLRGKASKTKTIHRLNSVSLTSLTSTKAGKMTVKWEKNGKASGYQIYYSKKSDFSSKKSLKVTSAKTVKKTISSLSKGKKYYVKIRAYKKVNDKTCYASWSSKKSVTIKK